MTVGQISRLPRPLFSSYAWQQHGTCSDADPSVFFHPEGERGPARRLRELKALAVCVDCPALQACRQHALSVREPYGVWGGTTENQRQLLHSTGQTRLHGYGAGRANAVAGP